MFHNDLEFIGIASHELKTPITSIKAYGEMIEGNLAAGNDMDSVQIIKNHGGDIYLSSKEGEGSVFYFTLPFKK